MKTLLMLSLIIIAALGDVEKTDMLQSKFDGLSAMVQNISAMIQSKFDNITSIVQSKFDYLNDIVLQVRSGLIHHVGVDNVISLSSCVDVQKYDKVSGVHTLVVNNNISVKVYCDQQTDNGGWTVIQRRQDGSVDFYRNWEEYEKGFGDLNGEFWIGLANLYLLTTNKNSTLRVDLTGYDGSTAYAMYNTFSISGAQDNYRLNIGGYSGTAGDSMKFHNDMQFTTYDRDHDYLSSGNCAKIYHGAWWYFMCHDPSLNGRYGVSSSSGPDASNGLVWYLWKNSHKSLKRVEMKIKE